MTIPLRMERTLREAEQALDWWVKQTGEEKARWLQCEETADEIDRMLKSPVLYDRDLARFGAVGDAWNAFRAATLTTLDFNDVIRAGGGEPLPTLKPRDRYELDAEKWQKGGCTDDKLETNTLRLIAMRCWFYSSGCLKENEAKRLSDTFLAYLNACLKYQWDRNQNWYEEELHERTDCDQCGERYMLENLSICTDCLNLRCFNCLDFPKAANGNRAHSCGLLGSGLGELVG